MNILKIEKNIPLPPLKIKRVSKYEFLEHLEIGDSFVVDDKTTDFSPKESVRSCYSYSLKLRQRGGRFEDFRIRTRTLIGLSGNPASVRIWRVQ